MLTGSNYVVYHRLLAAVISATAIIFSGACTRTSGDVKFQQYYVQGEQLYIRHCSNCHQKDGTGLGKLYPPLNKSDFMDNSVEEVICLIRNGRDGELKVNGVTYNQPMPPIPTLSDLEIAEISTYIYNTWEHSRGIVDVTTASRILQQCRSR